MSSKKKSGVAMFCTASVAGILIGMVASVICAYLDKQWNEQSQTSQEIATEELIDVPMVKNVIETQTANTEAEDEEFPEGWGEYLPPEVEAIVSAPSSEVIPDIVANQTYNEDLVSDVTLPNDYDPVLDESLDIESNKFLDLLRSYGITNVPNPVIHVCSYMSDNYLVILRIPDTDICWEYVCGTDGVIQASGDCFVNLRGSDYCTVYFVNGLPDNALAVYDASYEAHLAGYFKTDYVGGNEVTLVDLDTGEEVILLLEEND